MKKIKKQEVPSRKYIAQVEQVFEVVVEENRFGMVERSSIEREMVERFEREMEYSN